MTQTRRSKPVRRTERSENRLICTKRVSVIEGTIQGSEDSIHCRIIVHMDANGDIQRVPEFMVGSQHISMTFGRWLGALQEVGDLLGFEVRHP